MMTNIRNLAWEALWMADVRSRYFAHLAGKLRRTERVLALAVAISSSGTVAALLSGQDLVGKLLALATAVISAVLAGYKFDKRSSVAASHARQWLEIASEYDILWAQVDDLKEEEIAARHRELEKKHFPADELAIAEFQVDEKLLGTCFEEVAESRGIPESEGLLKAA